MKPLRTQKGLTMVELMVALLIGLILMWGVAQIFVANRQTYATLEGSARLQENGQYALDFVTQQLRMAGYFPNPYLATAGTKATHETLAFGNTAPITGTEGGGTAADDITVAYYTTGTDCVGAAPALAAQPKQTTDPSGTPTAMATNFLAIAPGASGQPALYCNGVEVAEGIENLQVRYGEDTDNDGVVDQYVPFNAVGTMNRVLTLQVALLAASVKELSPDPDTRTYDLLGTTVGPVNDRRVRRVYTATIKLRNRCTLLPITPPGGGAAATSVNSPCS